MLTGSIRTALSKLWVEVLIAVLVLFLTLFASGQERASARSSSAAIASRYLQSIGKSESFPANGREEVVFVGEARDRFGGWRIIVVSGHQVAWDSYALHDSYFDVTSLTWADTAADGSGGYIVTLRGCAPHQCADGRIGFALYSSRERRAYRAHVTTKDDGAYTVTYYPKSSVPSVYRERLNQLICIDSGILRPSALPIQCSSR